MRICAMTIIILSWVWCVLSWDGTTQQENKQHIKAWEAFAADLSQGDCSMTSLSEKARVTLPMGQVVSKEEYRSACAGTMADETVEETFIAAGQLASTETSTFSVETTITTAAVAPKGGMKRRVSYPAAFFLAVDPMTNKVPDDNFAPVIRPA